jgi:hypothetical protein
MQLDFGHLELPLCDSSDGVMSSVQYRGVTVADAQYLLERRLWALWHYSIVLEGAGPSAPTVCL